jgi:hypothetical protein
MVGIFQQEIEERGRLVITGDCRCEAVLRHNFLHAAFPSPWPLLTWPGSGQLIHHFSVSQSVIVSTILEGFSLPVCCAIRLLIRPPHIRNAGATIGKAATLSPPLRWRQHSASRQRDCIEYMSSAGGHQNYLFVAEFSAAPVQFTANHVIPTFRRH